MFVPRLFLYLIIMSYGWPCLNDGYNWSWDLLPNIIVMTTSVSRRLHIFCIKLKIRIWRFYSAAVHLASSLAKGYDPLYSSSPLASSDGFS